MKIKLVFLISIFSLFFSVAVHAEVAIKAEVDKIVMSTDDVLTYKLIVTSNEKVSPAPQFPKLEGFQILSKAQSQTVSFTKGGMRSIFVYALILKPQNVGKIKIAPASIKVKNNTYTSDSFEIEVKRGKVQPKAPPKKQAPQAPSRALPESNAPQYNL